jgi:hypothetical protein
VFILHTFRIEVRFKGKPFFTKDEKNLCLCRGKIFFFN